MLTWVLALVTMQLDLPHPVVFEVRTSWIRAFLEIIPIPENKSPYNVARWMGDEPLHQCWLALALSF